MQNRAIRGLKRAKAKREPKAKFVIFCEGARTEPGYFHALGRTVASLIVEVEIIPGQGVPLTIANRAFKRLSDMGGAPRFRRKRDSFAHRDEVWAVFDRDEHPGVMDAIGRCRDQGVGVAFSNPCFELWLVLHIQEFDKPDDRHSVQKLLASLRPEYDPKSGKVADFSALIANIATAEERAAVQLARRDSEGSSLGAPSTTVGLLTRRIRSFV